MFGQIVREGQAAGLFRAELDPFTTMWAFFGGLDEIAMQWVLSRKADRFSLEAGRRPRWPTMFIRGMLVASRAAADRK